MAESAVETALKSGYKYGAPFLTLGSVLLRWSIWGEIEDVSEGLQWVKI